MGQVLHVNSVLKKKLRAGEFASLIPLAIKRSLISKERPLEDTGRFARCQPEDALEEAAR
jgi:hypothetical protein